MNADAQAGQISDEDEPTVTSRLVGVVFPLEHQPEYNCREEATVGINLTFYCAEPEGVAEGIDEGSSQGACLDRDELSQILHPSVLPNQLANQMTDAPEEEHDASGAEEGTHHIDHQRDFRGVAHKLGEQVGCEHEERCPRWVTDFKLVSSCYELGAVPEACGRFHRATIDVGSNGEREPPHQVVN